MAPSSEKTDDLDKLCARLAMRDDIHSRDALVAITALRKENERLGESMRSYARYSQLHLERAEDAEARVAALEGEKGRLVQLLEEERELSDAWTSEVAELKARVAALEAVLVDMGYDVEALLTPSSPSQPPSDAPIAPE